MISIVTTITRTKEYECIWVFGHEGIHTACVSRVFVRDASPRVGKDPGPLFVKWEEHVSGEICGQGQRPIRITDVEESEAGTCEAVEVTRRALGLGLRGEIQPPAERGRHVCTVSPLIVSVVHVGLVVLDHAMLSTLSIIKVRIALIVVKEA